jgi:hypothetical protein
MSVFLIWCVAYYGHSMQCIPPQRMASLQECQIVAKHLQDVATREGGGPGTSQCLTIRH